MAQALGAAAIVLVALAWLDPALPWPPSTWTRDGFVRLVLNAMPALAMLLVLLAVTRRLWLAAWLVVIALWALYAANVAKLAALETPLVPADLRMLADPGPSARLLRHYVRFDGAATIELAAAVFCSWLLYRVVRPTIARGSRRLLVGLLGTLAAISLVQGAPPWRWLYDADRLGFEPWSIGDSVARTGLIGSLLLHQWDYSGHDVPSGDTDAAKKLLQRYAPAIEKRFAADDGELPDIVVVQSESFFDPAKLRGVAKGRYLRGFDRLAAHARSGDLVVPTFGGGTIRTEFEVLTGAPIRSLDGVQYPWVELDRREISALPRVLARHGYRTLAIHPNAGAFWNRARAYPALGFERFIDGAAFADDTIVGLFPGDAALTDRILAELDAEGPPQFIFAVSMEAHGPFDWRPGLDADRLAALRVPEELDEGGRYWFRNYLYLLEDADRELDRLATTLAKRTRRTLLLFYGDHLPALPPVYAQLGFDDDDKAESQAVPWLLYDTASAHRQVIDTQAWLLPAILLDEAGIGAASYFSTLDVLRGEMDLDRSANAIDDAPGLVALARLSLRGELDAMLDAMFGMREVRD
ncbi:MAG TPA: LTA synthase family protein [Rhodanobacteraceae bacterium]|nr:LTA synthase family protein [Rhodanobacteraceae bacterium]